MASKTWIDGTVIDSPWMQDVNDSTYGPTAPVTTLRGQLLDPTNVANGDALVGVKPSYTGTIATTQHQVNQEVVSVFRWFTPEQIADVIAGTHTLPITAKVQEAVTAVCGAGKTLYFPAGVYVLTPTAGKAITFPNTSFCVMGEGPTATAISLDSTSTTDRVFDFTGCNGPEKIIANVSINGKIGAGTTTSVGAYVSSANGLVFLNCWFRGLYSGIRKPNDASYVHFVNCVAEYCTTALEWDDAVQCSLVNAVFYRNLTDAYFTGDLDSFVWTTSSHIETNTYGVRLVGASNGSFKQLAFRQDFSAYTPDLIRLEGASTSNLFDGVSTKNFGRVLVSLASGASSTGNRFVNLRAGAIGTGLEVGAGNTGNRFSGQISGAGTGIVDAAGSNFYDDMDILSCTVRGVLLSNADNCEFTHVRMALNLVDWAVTGTVNNIWLDDVDTTMVGLSAKRLGSRRAGIYGRTFYVGSIPVSQVWLQGDRAVNVVPSVGAFKAYTVTVSGGANNGTRANSTAYAVGDWRIWSTGTTVWECTTAGTTAGAAPSIVGKVVGDTVSDGTVTWTMRSLTTATFVSEGNL